jgi:hypothetical protein
VLVDAAIAYSEGQLTAAEFAAVQDAVVSALDEVAGQAGATGEQVDGLRGRYADLPLDVVTDLIAIDLASGRIEDVDALLRQLPEEILTALRAEGGQAQRIVDEFLRRNRNLTLSVGFVAGPSTGRSITAGGVQARAEGGPTSGLTLVGEEGPELVDFSGRAFVYTADQTRQILDSASADPMARPSSSGGGRQRAFIESATIMVAPGRDLWQDLAQAERLAMAGVL